MLGYFYPGRFHSNVDLRVIFALIANQNVSHILRLIA